MKSYVMETKGLLDWQKSIDYYQIINWMLVSVLKFTPMYIIKTISLMNWSMYGSNGTSLYWL